MKKSEVAWERERGREREGGRVMAPCARSDVMLMENVGHPVAVNPDARLRARAKEMGWEIQDWGVSEAGKKKTTSMRKMPIFNFKKQPAQP